jgi:ATP-dependent protease ClpP protease subunit
MAINTYTIPIHGIIGEEVTINDVLLHIHKAKNCPILLLDINSAGGDVEESDKIYNALIGTQKTIITKNSGMVASAAVKLFLAGGCKANCNYNVKLGDYLIHNPWVQPEESTAQDLENMALQLREIEDNIAEFYAERTGCDVGIIKSYMVENKPLTAQQVDELGFATLVKEPVINARAYINKSKNMDNKQFEEKLTVFGALLNKLEKLFKPKGMVLQDVNGVTIDFGEAIADPSMIVVGTQNVMVDGTPANGQFVLADGTTITIENGNVTAIAPASGDNEIEDLKNQLETLKAENESLKTTNSTAVNQTETLKGEVMNLKKAYNEIKALTGNFEPKLENSPNKENQPTKFKYNGLKNK